MAKSPNTRLQRTPSASPPSPLSRKPFGGPGGAFGRWRLETVMYVGLTIGSLIWSAGCSSAALHPRVTSECKNVGTKSLKVQVGPGCEQIEAPTLIHCIDPEYPQEVWNRGIEGKVVAEAILTPDATLEGIKVVSSPSEALTALALKAFREWRYKPAFCRDSGKTLSVRLTMVATFSLRGR